MSGLKKLVFVDSVSDVQKIADHVPDARSFYGKIDATEKTRILRHFEETPGSTLIATSALEAGVDKIFKGLDCVILVGFPTVGANCLAQRIGRCGRTRPGLVIFISFAGSVYDAYVQKNVRMLTHPAPHVVSFCLSPGIITKHLQAAMTESGSIHPSCFVEAVDLSGDVIRPVPDLVKFLMDLNFRGSSSYAVNVMCNGQVLEEVGGRQIFWRVVPGGLFLVSTNTGHKKYRVVSLDIPRKIAEVVPANMEGVKRILFCFVLFCFVLFCFVLFCFVLFCFVLFCFVLFCFVCFCFCFVLFIFFFCFNYFQRSQASSSFGGRLAPNFN